jgi:hypothetical protein
LLHTLGAIAVHSRRPPATLLVLVMSAHCAVFWPSCPWVSCTTAIRDVAAYSNLSKPVVLHSASMAWLVLSKCDEIAPPKAPNLVVPWERQGSAFHARMCSALGLNHGADIVGAAVDQRFHVSIASSVIICTGRQFHLQSLTGT